MRSLWNIILILTPVLILSCKPKETKTQSKSAIDQVQLLEQRFGVLNPKLYLQPGSGYTKDDKAKIEALIQSSVWQTHQVLNSEGQDKSFNIHYFDLKIGNRDPIQFALHPQVSVFSAVEIRNLLALVSTNYFFDIEARISEKKIKDVSYQYLDVNLSNYQTASKILIKPSFSRGNKSILKLTPGSLFVMKNGGMTVGDGFGLWLGDTIDPPDDIVVLAIPAGDRPYYVTEPIPQKNTSADLLKLAKEALAENAKISLKYVNAKKIVYFDYSEEDAFHKQMSFGRYDQNNFPDQNAIIIENSPEILTLISGEKYIANTNLNFTNIKPKETKQQIDTKVEEFVAYMNFPSSDYKIVWRFVSNNKILFEILRLESGEYKIFSKQYYPQELREKSDKIKFFEVDGLTWKAGVELPKAGETDCTVYFNRPSIWLIREWNEIESKKIKCIP